ncbi:hypothetical protein SDC9_99907 [bioreactor metagenome]|uniref:Uncharacterized protein n=1 Tax=bioreactor metagenome TaxID=1076179 RepID=A0A645AIT1_9ZZZZ
MQKRHPERRGKECPFLFRRTPLPYHRKNDLQVILLALSNFFEKKFPDPGESHVRPVREVGKPAGLSSHGFPDRFEVHDLLCAGRLVERQRVDGAFEPFVAAALRFGTGGHGFVKFFHDVVVSAAVSVAGDGHLNDALAAKAAIVEFSGVEVEFHRAFAAREVEPPFRNRVAHGGGEGNADSVAEFGDRNRVVHKVGVVGERGGRRVGVPPGAEGFFTVFLHQLLIFGKEEVASAERRDARRQRTGEPVDQVEVVTAFFQDVRSGVPGQPPPVAHDVAAVFRRDVLGAVDRDQLAEFAGVEDLFRLAVDRRVTQHEAGGEDQAAFAVRFVNLPAILNRGRQRFLREHVLARPERREDLLLVVDVRGEHHHPLHAGDGQRLFDAVALLRRGLLPDAEGFRHHRLVRIISRKDLHSVSGVAQQVAHHAAAATPHSEHRHADFLFFRHIDPSVFRCFQGVRLDKKTVIAIYYTTGTQNSNG